MGVVEPLRPRHIGVFTSSSHELTDTNPPRRQCPFLDMRFQPIPRITRMKVNIVHFYVNEIRSTMNAN